MTLAPSTDFGIRGHEGKRYDLDPICAVPGCNQRAVHGHHLWPRSFLRGQPQEWVVTPDGIVIGNRVGLCVQHHADVTGELGGHKARIVFYAGLFWWKVMPHKEHVQGGWIDPDPEPLTYQPPGAAPAATTAPSDSPEDTTDLCPSCGKPKHSKPRQRLPKRKTTEWTLTVPEDAEIGSDVLDGWAEDLAVLLGFGDLSSRLVRYHAVATGLAWVVQNREQFAADLQEATHA